MGPLVASLMMKKLRQRGKVAYPGSHGSKTPQPHPRGCAGRDWRTSVPPSQAGAGWGEYEAARGSWLPSPHLTTSRALECFLRKSHQRPKGRALNAPWRPGAKLEWLLPADPSSRQHRHQHQDPRAWRTWDPLTQTGKMRPREGQAPRTSSTTCCVTLGKLSNLLVP